MAEFILPIRKADAVKRYWQGSKPTDCNICHGSFGKVFYDAATSQGWGLICHSCFSTYGYGLGTGRGQKYNMKTLEKVGG